MANNNFFLGGNDPLLSNPNQYGHGNAEAHLNALREQERRLMEQLQQGQQAQQQRPVQNASPIWDEIDKEFDSLTTMQQKALTENDDYRDAYAAVQEILNREFLRIMRPIVENTPDGQKALTRQLSVIKKEKKFIVEDTERKLKEFEEWQREQAKAKRSAKPQQ
jgi:hypothetical protein